ncbi:hypothetical protein BGM26_06555 [Bacillus sp. FJAT-29790]|uniref:hypothetical protein n=1 Tax=Bacillus sp. FJAT-29790 TaxID=1895002 RepID=UPI001C214A03|nr:hypothetical protein [Bacillus sp. FJAT-29790]MBU8878649.1 hypothetical protein [Bacillus sp. FJAT-29790]
MKNEHKKSNFKIKLVGVIALAVALGVYMFFVRGTTQDVNWLRINNVDVSNETIMIHAFNPNSAKTISGFDYYVKDKTVYIKLRGGTLVNRLGQSFVTENIVINDNFSDVNKVVLQGKAKQSKTIWNK